MINPSVVLNALKSDFREFCVGFSLREIEKIFSRVGFTRGNDAPSTRRDLVEYYYGFIDWKSIEGTKKFLEVIEYSWHLAEEETRKALHNILLDYGLEIKDHKIIWEYFYSSENKFSYQFPMGLPFGIPKPDFSITAEKGGQTLKFDLKDGLGLIEGKIYPNFTFQDLETFYKLNSHTNGVLRKAMLEMNKGYEEVQKRLKETERIDKGCEASFFVHYARKFNMRTENVPVLIPQAWIQWHSLPKKNLRSDSSLHKDELYRVDFVAFWNNKRYVILVDDISHYAVKGDLRWDASEENYSKRLKEDRKLRKEDWQVFRVSNWELRDDSRVEEILQDLREFIGF